MEARMPLSAEARARLAAQQAALVTALLAPGQVPAGFDPVRFRAAAASLAQKRAEAAVRAWPALARALGRRFGELFAAYAEVAPRPRVGGPLADGRAFTRWLVARGDLPEAGRLQTLAVDLRYASRPEGLVPRRWPTCRAVWLPQSRRLVIASWLPWLGAHWLNIPLARRHHDDAS
jgi:hypothetical protein